MKCLVVAFLVLFVTGSSADDNDMLKELDNEILFDILQQENPNGIENDANFCASKSNGDYADPTDCTKYITCSNGLTIKGRRCPNGLYFNPKTRACDYPSNVDCKSSSGENFCNGKKDGDYPDPNNCYGFITCSNGISYFMKCPSVTKFSRKTKQCENPADVVCPERDEVQFDTNRRSSPHPSRDPFCEDKVDGNYVNPYECEGFIICSNHLTFFFDCPSILQYNPKTERCDWPKNVNCGPTPKPKPTEKPRPPPTPAPSTFCENKGDGNYVDKDNCNGFIMCSNHLTYFFDCPANLRYNAKTDRCDWPKNVKCPPKRMQDALEETRRKKSPFCIKHGDGDYRDVTNCLGYFTCYFGYQFFRDCPGTERFNPETRKCDLPRNVKCAGAGGGSSTRGFCVKRKNGDYRDILNCNGFIKCSNGYTYYFDCPSILRFNRRTDQCDWPRNVRCYYR